MWRSRQHPATTRWRFGLCDSWKSASCLRAFGLGLTSASIELRRTGASTQFTLLNLEAALSPSAMGPPSTCLLDFGAMGSARACRRPDPVFACGKVMLLFGRNTVLGLQAMCRTMASALAAMRMAWRATCGSAHHSRRRDCWADPRVRCGCMQLAARLGVSTWISGYILRFGDGAPLQSAVRRRPSAFPIVG